MEHDNEYPPSTRTVCCCGISWKIIGNIPQPPRRRKTLWDFLLDEMRLIATDYHEERKLARHLLRGLAMRMQKARRELCEVCARIKKVAVEDCSHRATRPPQA